MRVIYTESDRVGDINLLWDALHEMSEACYTTDPDGNFTPRYAEQWERICEAMDRVTNELGLYETKMVK